MGLAPGGRILKWYAGFEGTLLSVKTWAPSPGVFVEKYPLPPLDDKALDDKARLKTLEGFIIDDCILARDLCKKEESLYYFVFREKNGRLS